MPCPTRRDLAQTMRAMMLSRECDRRESILFRQGKGFLAMRRAMEY
jgi:hypothetical protein